MNSLPRVKVFSTSGSVELADKVCLALRARLPEALQPEGGLAVCNAGFEMFDNGCILPHVENVRDHLVVIFCTHSSGIHDQLFELFHLIDAVENADAAEILLVFPYLDYVRSDKKDQPHISVMSRFLAEIINSHPIIRKKIILDPHNDHVLQYFRPTANGISAVLLLVDYLEREFLVPGGRTESVVVFCDQGAATRYREVARFLNLPTAYVDKQRVSGRTTPLGIVGNVEGKRCILLDDEVVTGGTATSDADMLLARGALSVVFSAIHPILSKKGVPASDLMARLEGSSIGTFIVTDSVPLADKLAGVKKFRVVSVVNLLAEAIKRIIMGESLTQLYLRDRVSLYR